MTEGIPSGRPRPTPFAVRLLLGATGLGLLGLAWAPWWTPAVVADLVWLVALIIDGVRLRACRLSAERRLPEVLVAFAPNRVEVVLRNLSNQRLTGEWLDSPPTDVEAPLRKQSFSLDAGERTHSTYILPSPPRGRLAFSDLHAEVEGPWHLTSASMRIPAAAIARSLPGLSDLMDGELHLRQRRESGRVRLRRLIEGREFDSLREFRAGDDLRMVDWKASARRGEPIVREYAPERNQSVMLMIDCGRHMVAHQAGRSKLDHALQAALRLGRACLERGDAVGLLTFGASVRSCVTPARGPGQLRALIEASFDVQAELEESDYRAAFDVVLQRVRRRAPAATRWGNDGVGRRTGREYVGRAARIST